MSEWAIFYVIGCVGAIFLYIVDATIGTAINWFTKGNILKGNLKKLDETDKQTFWEKVGIAVLLFVSSALLSWIQVLFSLWSILSKLFNLLRELLTSVPEDIKQLRFPLYNNPEMSREMVWAYLRAIEVKAGVGQPTESKLLSTMEYVTENHPYFNRVEALNHLKSLNVVNGETITSAIGRLRAEGLGDTL